MAQSKLELAVGTGQWDAGLRKAQQALNAFTQAQGGLQQALQKDNGDMQKFVQMMGRVDSTASTAKGQMNDYKRVLEQLTADYNKMSEAQRASIGQDYLNTIDALKQKFQAAKQQVDNFNRSLNDMGDVADEVKGKSVGLFGGGGLTDMLSVAGGNLLASGIQKFGSELADTVQQGIELARAGEGVRIAFERLNRPDLLDKLKEATHGTVSEIELMKAAVKFDDFKLPVEQLGTMLEFAQKKAKDTGQSVDYMVDSIVTGLGRKSLMILDNLGLSASQVKDKMAETGDMTTAVAAIIKEQMAEAGEYVETAADRAARAAADASNQMEALGRQAIPVAEEWGRTWNEISLGGMSFLTTVLGPIADSIRTIRELLNSEFKFKADIPNLASGPVSPWAGWKPGSDHKVQAQGGYVVVTDTNTGQVLGGKHFDNLSDTNNINDWRKSLFKSGGTTTSKKTSKDTFVNEITPGSIADYTKQIQELQKLQNEVSTTEGWQGLQDEINHLNVLVKELKGELKVEPYDFTKDTSKLVKSDNEAMTKRLGNVDKIITDSIKKHGRLIGNNKKEVSALNEISKMAGGVNSIASGIESLGVELPKELKDVLNGINGIISIVSGISTILIAIETLNKAQTGLSLIPGLAQGGIVPHAAGGYYVPGDRYSTDTTLIAANAGELVLNKAAQGNLAAMLEGGGRGTVNVTGMLRGEDIVLVADRYGRRTGKGELAFWK